MTKTPVRIPTAIHRVLQLLILSLLLLLTQMVLSWIRLKENVQFMVGCKNGPAICICQLLGHQNLAQLISRMKTMSVCPFPESFICVT
mmetsp:Transcript_22651/g.33243  ORF Transcript_22651/g.33243 Transcript_22651/m.33243 type:complete len:88 (+) Transcript_22651:365-628(+)